jgi:hypothetical protein
VKQDMVPYLPHFFLFVPINWFILIVHCTHSSFFGYRLTLNPHRLKPIRRTPTPLSLSTPNNCSCNLTIRERGKKNILSTFNHRIPILSKVLFFWFFILLPD